jgi:hypothetical protein
MIFPGRAALPRRRNRKFGRRETLAPPNTDLKLNNGSFLVAEKQACTFGAFHGKH